MTSILYVPLPEEEQATSTNHKYWDRSSKGNKNDIEPEWLVGTKRES